MLRLSWSRAVLWGVVAGALASSPCTADLQEIRKTGKLRVLVLEEAPEFFNWKPGRAPGLEREILQGFCRLEHLDLEIHPVASAPALFQALEKGEGDLGAGGLAADGGAAAYSSEVLPSRRLVVTWRHGPLASVDELKGEKRVGTARGTPLAEAVAAAGVPAEQVDDSFVPGGLVAGLKAGKISACIVGVESALPAKLVDPEIELGPYAGGKVSLAFALRREEPRLRSALDEYVDNMRRTSTWNRLVLRYFGDATVDILKAGR